MSLPLIDPIEKSIEDSNGKTKIFRIGKVPYLDGGRQICSQYITTAAPKIGDYQQNEDLARIMFKYIEVVDSSGSAIRLLTDDLVNSHITDFVTGIKLEAAALEHNLGFTLAGQLSEYRQSWLEKIPGVITKIVTALQPQSRSQDSAPDTS